MIVTDTNGASDTATVIVNVNHRPVFSQESYTVNIRKDHRGTIIQPTATDSDGDSLVYQMIGSTLNSLPFEVNGNTLSCSSDIPVGIYQFVLSASDAPFPSFDKVYTTVTVVVDNSPAGVLYVQGQNDTNPIDYNDIRQGQVGDCWLLAAMASMAKTRPDAIMQMIQPNDDGTYTVHHFDAAGSPVDTTVGPFYTLGTGQASYGDQDPVTHQRELWPVVLEAAIMMCMSANQIANSPPSVGQVMLAGPGSEFHSIVDNIFVSGYTLADLTGDVNAGKMITMNTTAAATTAGAGLVGTHAYAVLSVNGTLVTFYNPQGWEVTLDWSVLTRANGVWQYTVHP